MTASRWQRFRERYRSSRALRWTVDTLTVLALIVAVGILHGLLFSGSAPFASFTATYRLFHAISG